MTPAFAASRRPSERPDPVPRGPDLPIHDARDLTGTGQEAEILLDGIRYRLRITRAGKLILTK